MGYGCEGAALSRIEAKFEGEEMRSCSARCQKGKSRQVKSIIGESVCFG